MKKIKFKFEEDLQIDFYYENKKIEKPKKSSSLDFLKEGYDQWDDFHQKQFLKLKKKNPNLTFYDYWLKSIARKEMN